MKAYTNIPAGVIPSNFYGGDAAKQRAETKAREWRCEGEHAEVWEVGEFNRTYNTSMGEDPLAEHGGTSYLVVIFE